MDTTTRTNVTDTGYSYGGKDYTYETRLDANNNPYRVDVPVGTAPALNKAPDGTQPLVYGGQPKVSTTTISNTNKINEVPKMVSNFEQMQKKGISTDASGVPRYADGSQVPDYTDPTIPEGTTPIYGTVNGVGNRIVGYNTPNLTSGGMTSTYLDSTGQSTAGTSPEDAQMNDYLEQMKSSLDASTKTLIDNIQKKFDIRRREQTDINARQKAGYTNALLMGGATGQGSSAQYAPISSEGIIGAQEAFGIKQLADLDSEEADLIAQAKAAQESGNFKILEKKMALVEQKRQEKVAAATKLNETIAEQNKKLREQNIASLRDQNISDVYSQGITDVPTIIATLKKNGVNVTSAQVADTLKNIVPPGLDDLVKTMRINNAPLDKIQAVLSSGNINDAYKNAGVYGNGGTGITGEYNRYVADATSRGQIPISYDDFQTRDMNRKVSLARAGVAGSSNVGGSKTYANDLDAFIDNVVNLIPTKFGQETFKTSMAKARTDADKIRTAATVVLKNSPAPVKEAFANQAVGMKEIDKAIALLDEGVKTGAVVNGKQYAYNVVGKDFDPKLAAINAHIVGAIQPYRNTVTGAAWGTQEDNEYASLFGSTKYEPRELKERLQRVKEIMQEKSVQGLSSQVDPFSTGENFFETKTTMTNNIVQGENEAKATINTSYTTFTPETKTAVKVLFNKNYTNAQVVEYLKAKGVLK